MLNDFPAIMYVLIVAVCGYGFGLFLWWWHVNGHASEVYIYVTLLFAAIGFSNAMALYARMWLLVEPNSHHLFVNTVLWKLRMVPMTLLLLSIVIRMTQRVMNDKENEGGNPNDPSNAR